MYHCHICFYLAGHQGGLFEIIKGMSPLGHFTHEFLESPEAEQDLAAKADVILADLQGVEDVQGALQTLIAGKRGDTELILFAEKGQMSLLEDKLPEITDIWTNPMSEEEIRFRFRRWQQNCKREKDLQETSHFLEAVINSSPNLVWYKDKNGIHEKVNDSFCKTVNKTKERIEGRGHAYIWDVEEDDPACIESERQVMARRRTFVSEETIQTGGGTRLLTTYKSPLYDLDGSVMGTVGVGVDITQERAYKQEIIEKSNTLEKIFTSMECGVLCHTVDGTQIISINRAALKILGYDSQKELMEAGFDIVADSVVEEDKGNLRKCIQELKEGESISVEYRVQHKDGEVLHVMGNVKLIKENGRLFYQRFLLDCTAQKLQEKKKERRQMELIQALGVDYKLVCYFDLATGIGMPIRIENKDYDMFSPCSGVTISLKESMELYIGKFVHGDDREMLQQASGLDKLRKELAEKKVYFVNFRIYRNGEIEYFQMKAVRAGEWETSQGIVLGFRSVDEEIRNEMEKKNILEDALLQANNASKAKSVFLSNMSHDIRTPMNAIVGFTTLAISHIDHKEQVEEYLKKIMTSGNHLLNLINDVLDMSRIESGKMHLDEKPCSLPDILHGLRSILQADIRAKKLELYIDAVDIVNEEIYCDKLRLNQVLLNLLGNSVKYTGAGGIINMRVMEKAGAAAGYANFEFHIKDNGIGMSKEFVDHIFEPFERERNSTISGIQGTGLGMAITKNIVDMMNGTIKVNSEQGAGTEFIVSFTFRLNAGSKVPQETDEKKDDNKPVKLRSGRILLAEDIELNQEIAVTILEEAGFATEVAENGQIAVEMIAESKPGYYQLVLMDVQMPVMDGYEATRAIRSLDNKELASIPIIAMTANAFEEDKQDALKCGMNGHIAKPIDVGNLFATLDSVLA